jgi:hypothetical protein
MIPFCFHRFSFFLSARPRTPRFSAAVSDWKSVHVFANGLLRRVQASRLRFSNSAFLVPVRVVGRRNGYVSAALSFGVAPVIAGKSTCMSLWYIGIGDSQGSPCTEILPCSLLS